MSSVDISSFEQAVKSFDDIIERYDRESYDIAIRDALIQRFEYTYSLSIKVLIRVLKKYLPESVDSPTFNETIREANKHGLLLSDLETWDDFRQKRNLSSHTYNEDVALKVVSVTKDFQKEVHFLLEQIKTKI